MRYAVWLAQLLLMAVDVVVACQLDVARTLGLSAEYQRGPWQEGESATLAVTFAAVHGVALAVSAVAGERTPPLRTPRWWFVQTGIALAAVAAASLVTFALSPYPFDPVLHAAVFVVVLGTYLGGTVVAWLSIRVPDDSGTRPAWRAADWLDGVRALGSVWTAVVIVLLIPPVYFSAVVVDSRAERMDQFDKTFVRLPKAPPPPTAWRLEDVLPGKGFAQPIDLAFTETEPDAMYLLSRNGWIERVTYRGPNAGETEVVVDFTSVVGRIVGELGALSFALHPRFGDAAAPQRGYVYTLIAYVLESGDHFTELVRFDLAASDPDARLASKLTLLKLPRPPTPLHTGGSVRFGPDGMCYFSIGDLGQFYGQRVDRTLCSGVFRIDVDQRGGDVSAPIRRQPDGGFARHYMIPRDNPFVGRPDAFEEYFALGLRQPYRMSFDEVTGELWVGDVGEIEWEEITRVRAGSNGQWPRREGHEPFDETWLPESLVLPETTLGEPTPPLYAYRHTDQGQSVVGGFVYRGSLHPTLYGRYVFGDYYSSIVAALDFAADPPEMTVLATANDVFFPGIVGVERGPRGEIFVLDLGVLGRSDGRVLGLVEGGDSDAAVVAGVDAVGPVERVESKFALICARCHGQDGKGLPSLTVGMAPRPDFTSAQWQGSVTDAHIRKAIVEGGLAVGKSKDMPPWGAFFADEELDAIVRKIRAFGADASSAAGPRSSDATASPLAR